jgi:hypothetical protein
VDPSDVSTFPEVPGAIIFPAKEDVPLPKTTLFAVNVEAPVPPRATAKVPDETLEALIAVSAMPLPDMDVVVIAFAVKFPEESRATIVEAPLALSAVVRTLAMVPLAIFEALIAVKATPLPEIEVVVIAFAVKFPDASLATMVDAPLADAAVVLAFEIVPLEIFDALISVKPAPLPLCAPETVTNVPTFAAKDPFESLATMVEAPLALAAVVLALAMVPAEMLEALMLVIVKPAPVNLLRIRCQ